MKGKDIIENFMNEMDPELLKKIQVLSSIASMKIYDLHAKAIACHCECMGMNAENAIASCAGKTPPYPDVHFYEVMRKWQLVDEKGTPII